MEISSEAQETPTQNIHPFNSEIHEAIRRQDFQTVSELLDNGEKLCHGDGENCFITAHSYTGNWPFIKKLLEIDPAGVHARSEMHETIFMFFPEQYEYLINRGADINAVSKEGDNVLLWAIKSRSPINVVTKLIDMGSDVKAKDDDGATALLLAFDLYNEYEIIEKLTNSGSDLNAETSRITLLMQAIRCSSKFETPNNFIQNLIKNGANVCAVTAEGQTALTAACAVIDLRLLKFLMASGADTSVKLKDGAEAGAFIEDLIARADPIAVYRHFKHTALAAACEVGNFDLVEYLLESGADPNARPEDVDDVYPDVLSVACAQENVNILKVLLHHGAILKPEINYMKLATENNLVSHVKVLLQYNVNPCIKDHFGKTPFMIACEKCHIEIALILLESGRIDPLAVDDDNENALYYLYTSEKSMFGFRAELYWYVQKLKLVEKLLVLDSDVFRTNVNSYYLLTFRVLLIMQNISGTYVKKCEINLITLKLAAITFQKIIQIATVKYHTLVDKSNVPIIFSVIGHISILTRHRNFDELVYNIFISPFKNVAEFVNFDISTFLCHDHDPLQETEDAINIDALGIAIVTEQPNHQYCPVEMKKRIEMLCACGYAIIPSDPTIISLLSVLMCIPDGRENYQELSKYLISKGVNITQRLLAFEEETLQSLSQELGLFDSLWLAAICGKMSCVALLLHYWSHHPLFLLLFIEPSFCRTKEVLNQLYYTLARIGGRMPHGHPKIPDIQNKLEEYAMQSRRHQEILAHFNSMQSCAPSLRSLCLNQIRGATTPNNDLPQQLASLFHPRLENYFLY